ncbi:unnamed protein product [Pedinophyceae sp. YPF-701]|nr:unnamed protein product [Pedinophyceae sp. YPF-701]
MDIPRSTVRQLQAAGAPPHRPGATESRCRAQLAMALQMMEDKAMREHALICAKSCLTASADSHLASDLMKGLVSGMATCSPQARRVRAQAAAYAVSIRGLHYFWPAVPAVVKALADSIAAERMSANTQPLADLAGALVSAGVAAAGPPGDGEQWAPPQARSKAWVSRTMLRPLVTHLQSPDRDAVGRAGSCLAAGVRAASAAAVEGCPTARAAVSDCLTMVVNALSQRISQASVAASTRSAAGRGKAGGGVLSADALLPVSSAVRVVGVPGGDTTRRLATLCVSCADSTDWRVRAAAADTIAALLRALATGAARGDAEAPPGAEDAACAAGKVRSALEGDRVQDVRRAAKGLSGDMYALSRIIAYPGAPAEGPDDVEATIREAQTPLPARPVVAGTLSPGAAGGSVGAWSPDAIPDDGGAGVAAAAGRPHIEDATVTAPAVVPTAPAPTRKARGGRRSRPASHRRAGKAARTPAKRRPHAAGGGPAEGCFGPARRRRLWSSSTDVPVQIFVTQQPPPVPGEPAPEPAAAAPSAAGGRAQALRSAGPSPARPAAGAPAEDEELLGAELIIRLPQRAAEGGPSGGDAPAGDAAGWRVEVYSPGGTRFTPEEAQVLLSMGRDGKVGDAPEAKPEAPGATRPPAALDHARAGDGAGSAGPASPRRDDDAEVRDAPGGVERGTQTPSRAPVHKQLAVVAAEEARGRPRRVRFGSGRSDDGDDEGEGPQGALRSAQWAVDSQELSAAMLRRGMGASVSRSRRGSRAGRTDRSVRGSLPDSVSESTGSRARSERARSRGRRSSALSSAHRSRSAASGRRQPRPGSRTWFLDESCDMGDGGGILTAPPAPRPRREVEDVLVHEAAGRGPSGVRVQTWFFESRDDMDLEVGARVYDSRRALATGDARDSRSKSRMRPVWVVQEQISALQLPVNVADGDSVRSGGSGAEEEGADGDAARSTAATQRGRASGDGDGSADGGSAPHAAAAPVARWGIDSPSEGGAGAGQRRSVSEHAASDGPSHEDEVVFEHVPSNRPVAFLASDVEDLAGVEQADRSSQEQGGSSGTAYHTVWGGSSRTSQRTPHSSPPREEPAPAQQDSAPTQEQPAPATPEHGEHDGHGGQWRVWNVGDALERADDPDSEAAASWLLSMSPPRPREVPRSPPGSVRASIEDWAAATVRATSEGGGPSNTPPRTPPRPWSGASPEGIQSEAAGPSGDVDVVERAVAQALENVAAAHRDEMAGLVRGVVGEHLKAVRDRFEQEEREEATRIAAELAEAAAELRKRASAEMRAVRADLRARMAAELETRLPVVIETLGRIVGDGSGGIAGLM